MLSLKHHGVMAAQGREVPESGFDPRWWWWIVNRSSFRDAYLLERRRCEGVMPSPGVIVLSRSTTIREWIICAILCRDDVFSVSPSLDMALDWGSRIT